MCVKGGEPLDLVLRAIRSTAASLSTDDAIFLRIDGDVPSSLIAYQAAAAPIALLLRPASRCEGLARGLNVLLEEVLADSQWQLIARMDSDDESLPGRMEKQRRWLETHPDVDILGTACVEVDQLCRPLQLKRMPLTHGTIVRTLPRKNPLNHPTVMMRRRVFEGGLRYRTDVSRTEDYHLWVSAAQQGYTFANLSEPLLNFRRDTGFFARRSGFRQACADLHVRLRATYVLGRHNPINPIWALSAFLLRLLPGKVQQVLYAYLR